MLEEKAKKISQKVYQTIVSDKIPNTFTGKIILNIQTGGVSGDSELEINVVGKVKI